MTKNPVVVRGIIVRSRNIFATIGAIVEGNITFFTQLREKARTEAFELMVEHAEEAGAKGIIGMRYDANEVMGGVTEVPAYGTAVVPEKL
ncbi:MAG: heavy metal-binding domain-containing protein [Ignavibacteria bacterium]|nr:heavy metal-binding domain-containing protein [Ignavibacteria bacterium]